MIEDIITKTIKEITINEYDKTILKKIKYGFKLNKEERLKCMLIPYKIRLYKLVKGRL